jgi:signal transduction histidine kinase
MQVPQWLRPPRLLLLLFVGTMLSFLAGLGYFGWQSLERNRILETDGIRQGLTRSADLVTAQIRQTLAAFDGELVRLSRVPIAELDGTAAAVAKDLGDDALLVAFEADTVRAYPLQRLLYRPAIAVPAEPDPQVFAPGEAYEERNEDYPRAILYFRDLADTEEAPDIRAGALYRLGRNQRKAGRPTEALATYAELERLSSAWILERPADLFARVARADLLAELGRRDDLLEEARRLDRDLRSGRWPLTRPQYLRYSEDVQQWLAGDGASAHQDEAALALAKSVEDLWTQWREDSTAAGSMSGRAMVPVRAGRPMFRMWRGTSERFLALVGGQEFLKDRVVDPLNDLLSEQRVGVLLTDRASGFEMDHALPASSTIQGAAPRDGLRFDAPARDTNLPWDLRLVSASSGPNEADFARNRTLLALAIGVLALLVVAGSYFSGRAITREMEAARLQSDFVAAVSHEFRTPLTLLRQFSDLLADGRVANDEERHQYYAALQRGTRRLTRLVEDLLDFGRMEAGSHGFRFMNVDAHGWIQHVIADFRDQFRGQGYQVELGWDLPADTMIRADEAAIGRALWNLLDNAVKYSPSSKTIRVDGTRRDGKLTVSVHDRGIGVPPAERRAIFRKFVRGSVPDGSVVRGTGLGLALVVQIMRAHGGDVRLDSTSAEGSTFSLVLPLAGETVPLRAQRSTARSGASTVAPVNQER